MNKILLIDIDRQMFLTKHYSTKWFSFHMPDFFHWAIFLIQWIAIKVGYKKLLNKFQGNITVKPLVQSPLNDNNFVKFMRETGQGGKNFTYIFY